MNDPAGIAPLDEFFEEMLADLVARAWGTAWEQSQVDAVEKKWREKWAQAKARASTTPDP